LRRRLPPIAVTLLVLLSLPRPAWAAPGSLDRTFSRDGIQTAFRAGGRAYAVAIDGQGRILVAGEAVNGSHDVAVTRLLPGGRLDRSFGGDGQVRIDLGASDRALDVAAAPGGKIVVVGERIWARRSSWFVIRLRSGGARDRTFGGDGIVFTDFGRRFQAADAVAMQSKGRILVGGSISNGTAEDWAFARYRSGGARDRSFGGDGRVVLSLSVSAEEVQDLAVTGTGIIAAGYAERRFLPRFAVAKLHLDGTSARGFGNRGARLVDLGPGGDAAFGLAVQPDGKPVLAGYASAGGRTDWGVVRMTAGGRLDRGFGGDGIVATAFTAAYELAQAVAIQGTGRIVVAGSAHGPGGTDDLTVVRYLPGGRIDGSFSGDGRAFFNPFGENDVARDVLVHAGRIVVVGESMAGGVQRMTILRILA
jgi:uncharacterized delta-60 repeat protein